MKATTLVLLTILKKTKMHFEKFKYVENTGFNEKNIDASYSAHQG